MESIILAQFNNWGQLAIAAVVILGIVAIVVIAVRAMAIPVPQWVWHVLGVLLIVVVCVFAIKFLLAL